MRTIAFIIAIFLSLSLSGQKWERLTQEFNLHSENAQFSEALDDALKALRYSRRKLDSTDVRFMLSYYNVALAYHGLMELEMAKMNIIMAYRLILPFFAYDPDHAEVCELYGRIETELGYHQTAASLLSSAREINLEVFGKESHEYIRSLYFMAELEMARSQWDKMAILLEEALDIHERNFLKDQDFARYANFLGLIYMNNEQYPNSALNFEKALAAFREPGVVKNFTYGHVSNNLGLVYYYESDFENAALNFERADSIYLVLMEGYSENYMMLLNNLASLYYSWEKPDLAREAFQKLEEYMDRYPHRQDLNYIQGIENTAHYYSAIGELEISANYYRSAIETRRLVTPTDSLALARSMLFLAMVYDDGSRPGLAAETAVESLGILLKKLPSSDYEVVWVFAFLGEAFFDSDQEERALYYWQLAREQFELAEEEQYPDELSVYNYLGMLYHKQNRFREAIQCLERAHQLDPEEPGVLINLGSTYFDIGNHAEARAMFEKARENYGRIYGTGHPDYANALIHNIGFQASYGAFDDEMLKEIREVERICLKNEVDSTDRLFIDCLRAYRSYYFGMKEYHQAIAYGNQLSRLVEKGYGRNSRFYAESMLEQADSYVMLGDKENLALLYSEAYDIASFLDDENRESLLYFIESGRFADYYYLEEYDISRKSIEWVIEKDKARFLELQNILSIQERANFYGNLTHLADYNNFLMHFPEDPDVLTNALNNRLFIKGLLMYSESNQRDALAQSSDTSLTRIHDEYLSSKNRLSNLQSEFGVDHEILDSIEFRIQQLEKEISRRLGEGMENKYASLTWQDIRSSLGEDEAAVEVILFYHRTAPPRITLHPYYLAFIITRETVEQPRLLMLSDAVELIDEYNGYWDYMNAGNEHGLPDSRLYDQLWSKLDEAIEGKKTIFFSPDGMYHQLNVEALADREGNYMINKYKIKYVNSLKEVLKPHQDYGHNTHALLAGDPRFRMSLASFPDPVPVESIRSVSEFQSRMFPGTYLSDLPGTRTEVDSIGSMLKSQGWECTMLTGPAASEDAIAAVKNPRVLHLATHGFFARNTNQVSDTAAKDNKRGLYVFDMESFSRSCLFFSGAQSTLFYGYDYQEGSGDGILTAWEIMEMDLDSTELVVLSACETGLGDVLNSEGVSGLRRAFHLAGARRVLISLWAVDDHATQLLMREFYSNWLMGMDMDQSLAVAKRYMINETSYQHPRYWAAFILSGI